jgi:hypothetical protein
VELLGLQRKPATLVIAMPQHRRSGVADPAATGIEIEDCRTKRRVRIPQSAEQVTPLHLDELPLLGREHAVGDGPTPP